jgi:hypothetical protein
MDNNHIKNIIFKETTITRQLLPASVRLKGKSLSLRRSKIRNFFFTIQIM